jgi:hypothetical protein
MIIVVGKGPDYAMRQGLLEIFHRAVVDIAGMEVFHESTSDRSLWVVAKMATAYLTANGVGCAEITGLNFVALSAKFNVSGGTIDLRLNLPDELAVEWSNALANYFANYIKEFFKNSNVAKSKR